jgi:hypothetical protein
MAQRRTRTWEADHLEDHQEEEDRGPPGGIPMPMPQAPQPGGHHGDKLVGNPPIIFTGDRSKAEQFITQWQLYKGVNITNMLMHNPYQRAMFFLTYIQGNLVNEWVKGVNAWLRTLKSPHKDGPQQMNVSGTELSVPSIGNMPMY